VNGSTSECDAGLHVGTWPVFGPSGGDAVYVNGSALLGRPSQNHFYEVWVR
jgi:hypothetical protein